MIKKVRFPQIDANIAEATITRWLKAEGEKLKKGELLLEITTDKGAIEVEAPVGGTLRRIVAAVNSTVPVGYVLALVGDPGDALPDVSAENREILAKHQAELGKAPPAAAEIPKAAGGVVRATPAARRLAREKGVDLAAVQQALKVEIVNEDAINRFLAAN